VCAEATEWALICVLERERERERVKGFFVASVRLFFALLCLFSSLLPVTKHAHIPFPSFPLPFSLSPLCLPFFPLPFSRVTNSVSGKTSYLVAGDMPGEKKVKTAEEKVRKKGQKEI